MIPMKRLPLIIIALGILCLAACKREITFTPGNPASVISPSPPNVTVDMNRGDIVVFINDDDRIHKIFVFPGGIPMPANPVGTTIYPPGSGTGRPSTYTWTIPKTTTPPASYTWVCLIHTGETGAITVNP